MKVIMVELRDRGVEVPRRLLGDRCTRKHAGMLVIKDVTDQGQRRPVKVARIMQGQAIKRELNDVRIVWAADGRFTLTGEERALDEQGRTVAFCQSWLCELDLESETDIIGDKWMAEARR